MEDFNKSHLRVEGIVAEYLVSFSLRTSTSDNPILKDQLEFQPLFPDQLHEYVMGTQ